MRKLMMLLIALLLMITVAFADGDPNIDGGGGDMGGGDVGGGSFWTVGDDGVRVTIVDMEYDPKPVRVLDFSNKAITVDFYFGLRSKLTYRNSPLEMKLGGNYKAVTPDNPLPQIISSSGGANIDAVKSYFGTEGTINDISQKTGIDYNRLISGDFVLLLEPVIYVKYDGKTIGMTATEAALYDQVLNGKLKSKLGYATHQNLPLAMFLEKPDLWLPCMGWSSYWCAQRQRDYFLTGAGYSALP